MRNPNYCPIKDIADWLRITIDTNSDPNTTMASEFILANEDEIDRLTGHTWQDNKFVTEVFDVQKAYDWGRGMPVYMRHRRIKTFDEALGDKFEVWDGDSWVIQNVGQREGNVMYFEELNGITYIRGYLFTILRKSRFRITYRYGGDGEVYEGETVPRDIRKACKLMTCLDIISSDFQMSQVPYGAEGNVDKQKVMDRWQKEVDKIIWSRSELSVV